MSDRHESASGGPPRTEEREFINLLEKKVEEAKRAIEAKLEAALGSIEQAHQEAQRHAEKAVVFGYRLAHADVYFQRGDFENALRTYEGALEINPDSSLAWDGKGMALANMGRTQEALEAHNRAVALEPSFARAWNNKGVALGELQRYQEAIEAYTQAINHDPLFANAWYNIALTSAVLGDRERMMEGLKKVLLLDSSFRDAIRDDFENYIDERDLRTLLG